MYGPPSKEYLAKLKDEELVREFKQACTIGCEADNTEKISALQEELVVRFWRLRFRLETAPIRW